MADIEQPPERTRRDEFATSRDSAPGHRHTPGVTRREEGSAGPSLVRLPGELAGRFTVLGELPAHGAESDLLHVHDAAGDELVVKIFRRGFAADRSVWQKLPTLDSPHVVRILETGHAEGRDYEVIEYVPAGNLRTLGERLPAALVADVAAQLAAGLARLHRAGIVHRDLKPENVLVRSATPVRLAITDFGLSRVIEQSVVFASSSRTLAYAAPESLSGQVSPARDWWSLGIIVRELLTGHTPFAGMSETAVVDHLATRTIDCDDVDDPRMRLLCRGLLTRDPRRRWGATEVERWLDGESPPVAESEPAAAPATGPVTALAFGGRSYTDRRELAQALISDWTSATRYFFGVMHSPTGPSEAWRTLREWLTGFDDDPEGRVRLIDEGLTGDLPPDVKLVHLLRWLDPTLPPYLMGLRLLPDDLPALAAAVDDDGHVDHPAAARAVRSLWEHRLLPELAAFSGADDLAAIDDRWRGLAASWNRHAGWLRSQLPRAANRLPDAGAPGPEEAPDLLADLLALAGQPRVAKEALGTAAARARASVREPVPWFAWLSDQAGDDPLRLLAVIRAAPEAALEVAAATRHRYEAERRAAEEHRRWAELERRRLSGRRAAITRAVLWTLPLIVVWLAGTWVVLRMSDGGDGTSAVGGLQRSGSAPEGLLIAMAILTCAFHAATEGVLAWRQGGDYLSLGPWSFAAKALRGTSRGLSSASRAMSGAARRTGPRGCGLLLFVGVVPAFLVLLLITALLSIVWLLWLAVLVVAPIGHVVASGVRLQRWHQERAVMGVR